MTLRYQGVGLAVTQAGTAITHGLTQATSIAAAAAAAPTEWSWNFTNALSSNNSAAGGNSLYRVGAPTTVSLTIASTSGAASVDVFCSIPNSMLN